MLVQDSIIRHELNRIHAILVSDPEVIDKAKAKVELLNDLNIIDEDQYMFECARLDGLLHK